MSVSMRDMRDTAASTSSDHGTVSNPNRVPGENKPFSSLRSNQDDVHPPSYSELATTALFDKTIAAASPNLF